MDADPELLDNPFTIRRIGNRTIAVDEPPRAVPVRVIGVPGSTPIPTTERDGRGRWRRGRHELPFARVSQDGLHELGDTGRDPQRRRTNRSFNALTETMRRMKGPPKRGVDPEVAYQRIRRSLR